MHKPRKGWLWLLLLLPLALVLAATLGTPAASAKPGPPPSLAEGHITADQQRHPCLTTATHVGGYVYLAPCTSKHNAEQVWKIARFKSVIIVALKAHPGICLGGKPKEVKIRGQVFHYAVTYNCGQQITVPESLAIGHVGGVYNTIISVSKRLLSAPLRGNNRTARWLFSNGNIPFTQVWLFPKFKPI